MIREPLERLFISKFTKTFSFKFRETPAEDEAKSLQIVLCFFIENNSFLLENFGNKNIQIDYQFWYIFKIEKKIQLKTQTI